MALNIFKNHDDHIWTIVCPGPSMDEPGRLVQFTPGRLIAVNTAIRYNLEFSHWAIVDLDLFRECLLAFAANPVSFRRVRSATLWTPMRWWDDLEYSNEFPSFLKQEYKFMNFDHEVYPCKNYDDLARGMPFGKDLDWRAYTLLTAIAYAVRSAARQINIYGADFAGDKYSRVGIITEKTNLSDDRWRHERELFEAIQASCKDNGIIVRRM